MVVLSDSIWKECTDTTRSTGAYIVFYQVGPIDNSTHVSGPVSQISAKSEYNASCTTGMATAHFRIPNNAFMNNDQDVVT